MTDNTLNLLGLALRGGNLAVGEEPVVEACRLEQAKVVLTAADAADNSAEKAARLAQRAAVPHVPLPRSKEQLGTALGKRSCAMIAVTDAGLAAALLERLAQEDEAFRPVAEQLSEKAGRKGRPQKKRSNSQAERPKQPNRKS